ncbi:LysM peptidoglycan-binding domain-containing protein [Bacillus sp. AFS040349]|uniref:LysM peptidoglycan-binding domain-containing protein n=1 Tax=Bacillus sp. AFS040349 TaxID=2033502 RepID=UPI0021002069|nr:LysM domain-containing protein [Bacillus sp. AFS040349]
MEFWLIDGNGRQKLRLPVPPPNYLNETGQDVYIQEINDLGEHSTKGDAKLDRTTLKSFFPSVYYPFCQYKNFPKPYEFVEIINVWVHNDLPMRLLITETNINKLFFIEDFSYGERAGSRDVEFELSLIEYRSIPKKKSSSSGTTTTSSRSEKTPSKPKTHTVVKGDTLWAIARNYYNDPYKWDEIAKANDVKDPRKLQIGKVLRLP